MASGEKIFNTSTYIQCRLAWTETDINVAANTSRVWASMSYRRTNSYGGTTYEEGYGFHVIIAGQWYKVGESVSIPPYDNDWHEIGAASRVLTHNDDGSLTVGIGCYHDGVLGLFDCNESTTATLDTIPRASTPSATPNPITLSATTNPLTVNTNRKANIFTHTVTCAIGSYSETKTDITESTTFDIPKTVLADFAQNETTLAGTITCVTYNGSTNIGTKTATFTAQIDATQERPKITSITLTDTNPNSAAIETAGTYIKYATNLRAVIALGVDGSYTQLASAVVQCGNSQRTYALSGTAQTITYTFDKLDADSLIVTVYDKRGTARTQTQTWQLVPYRDITVTGAVDRTSETGNVISFNLTGACFAGSFGNTSNQVTVTYKYKLHTATTWSDGAETFTFTPSGTGETTYTYSNTLAGFAYDQQYDLIFTVEDMFTTASTRSLTLTVGIPVYGNGADFFSIYGKSYLHFDRDNPNKFWDLKEGLDAIMEYHAETNMMNVTAITETKNGATFTVSEDGTVTVNGTPTTDTNFLVGYSRKLDTTKTWYFTGCPVGGSSQTYYCGWETAVVAPEFPPLVMAADTGNGSELIPMWGYPAYCPFYIVIKSGTTVSNLTFKPMIRDVRIASDSYVSPYNKIKTVEYEFYNTTLNTYNGNEYQLTLPNDFKKSLGVVVRDAWPNQNWNNGAVISLVRDLTLEANATDAGTAKNVYLTTTSGQSYNVKLWLIYICQ